MKQQMVLKDQRGVVLVIALVMLLVLSLIGISGVTTTNHETSMAGNERLYSQAFYAADGGIEDFKATAPTNYAFLTDSANTGTYYAAPPSVPGGGTYDITWERLGVFHTGGTSGQIYRVRSEGVAPNFPVAGRVVVEALIEIGTSTPGYD